MTTKVMQTSIHGRKLGLGTKNELVSNERQISPICADATITVGDEAANVRAITIQLQDSAGADIAYAEVVELFVYSDTTHTALATGGSTGIAIGTDGAIAETRVAKLIFSLISEADGDIDLTWTDTGTESVVLGLRLPTGVWVYSDAFANT